MTFLAVVGALAIAFVLAIVGFLVWLRWKIRRMATQIVGTLEGLGDGARKAPSVPPFRIKLAPVAAVEWDAPENVEEIVRVLRESQFVDVGAFIAAPADSRLTAFCLPQEAAYAVIYEIPESHQWMEFFSYFEDGSSVTYSTAQDTLLDRSEQKLVRFFEGFGAEELWRTFLRERPRKALVRITPETFGSHFERAYAEGMDWLIARGGPTEEEVRRIAARKGQIYTPAVFLSIRGRWTTAIGRFRQTEDADRLPAGGSDATASGYETE